MANVPLWEQNEYVLNLPNNARRNNAAGAGGNNIVENVVPHQWNYNANKNIAIRNNIRREQQELRNRARVSSKKQIINSFVGRPNRNYMLEDEARVLGLNDGDIAVIRNEIARMRAEDPDLVARQAANNALAQEIMNENNNNGEPNANQMGGKRRRRRATRKTRKGRKNRKSRARKH